jgi:hypothetical protein
MEDNKVRKYLTERKYTPAEAMSIAEELYDVAVEEAGNYAQERSNDEDEQDDIVTLIMKQLGVIIKKKY